MPSSGAHVPPTCGKTERLRAAGPCPCCTLEQRLHELLANDAGGIPPKLQALNDTLAEIERVGTAVRWLSGGIVSTVVSDLGSGRRSLTHEALDELPVSKVVEHIRNVLVATGTLPQRDEQMVRLKRHVNDLVTSHTTAGGRKILHRYATWHLLRRLRRRQPQLSQHRGLRLRQCVLHGPGLRSAHCREEHHHRQQKQGAAGVRSPSGWLEPCEGSGVISRGPDHRPLRGDGPRGRGPTPPPKRGER